MLDGTVRVLVVEDEVKLASLIRKALREEGILADLAIKGEDALWMAAATTHDVLLVDVNLPGIDGFQVSHRLSVDGIRTPILWLTARDAGADAAYPRADGARQLGFCVRDAVRETRQGDGERCTRSPLGKPTSREPLPTRDSPRRARERHPIDAQDHVWFPQPRSSGNRTTDSVAEPCSPSRHPARTYYPSGCGRWAAPSARSKRKRNGT